MSSTNSVHLNDLIIFKIIDISLTYRGYKSYAITSCKRWPRKRTIQMWASQCVALVCRKWFALVTTHYTTSFKLDTSSLQSVNRLTTILRNINNQTTTTAKTKTKQTTNWNDRNLTSLTIYTPEFTRSLPSKRFTELYRLLEQCNTITDIKTRTQGSCFRYCDYWFNTSTVTSLSIDQTRMTTGEESTVDCDLWNHPCLQSINRLHLRTERQAHRSYYPFFESDNITSVSVDGPNLVASLCDQQVSSNLSQIVLWCSFSIDQLIAILSQVKSLISLGLRRHGSTRTDWISADKDHRASVIKSLIANHSNLTELALVQDRFRKEVNIGMVWIDVLDTLFAEPKLRLQRFECRYQKDVLYCSALFFDALCTNNTLTYLSIGHLTSNQFESIAKVIAKNVTIRTLSLDCSESSSNPSKLFKTIYPSLLANRSITELSFPFSVYYLSIDWSFMDDAIIQLELCNQLNTVFMFQGKHRKVYIRSPTMEYSEHHLHQQEKKAIRFTEEKELFDINSYALPEDSDSQSDIGNDESRDDEYSSCEQDEND
ncbi:hypothetical protein PPL_04322 [Heterostelium album PN500]|uniref:Uncharacterized protein n=1 Tax=Heterostelium pallidum (strain ATCC 26659 / Pp 5 / PN500) TaxID=670386 RepID=D3B787_HETP5|nr:hypothetical protein PPL_04322 [Heterostelium album PN500]EFA82630.1 hypothetical protein PPL_04322 [Heterostelium album PN500]|eukprot:XP_020434747.1 hypothetical protein PPL_04322 [Heterostelium album PN500]